MRNQNWLGKLLILCLAVPFIGCIGSNEVDAISVTPAAVDFGGTGLQVQLTAVATIGHGSHPSTFENVTDQATWSTASKDVAVVSISGVVTSTGPGSTIPVTASMQGFTGYVSGSSLITVTLPTAATSDLEHGTPLSIVQGSQTTAMRGETRQFTAIRVSGATGVREDLTDSVTWGSANPAIASVSKSGLVTGLNPGATTITATTTNPDKSVVIAAAPFKVAGEGAPGTAR